MKDKVLSEDWNHPDSVTVMLQNVIRRKWGVHVYAKEVDFKICLLAKGVPQCESETGLVWDHENVSEINFFIEGFLAGAQEVAIFFKC